MACTYTNGPNTRQNLITRLISKSGLAALFRAATVGRGRFVLAFHGITAVRPVDVPRTIQPSMSVDEFRSVLGWLRQRFKFLTPAEFFQADQRGVLLTLDDGFASNFTNALPLLCDFDAPAIFFVSVQHVVNPRDWLPASRERALRHWPSVDAVPDDLAAQFWDGMTQDQVREAARHPLITIGSHTIGHPHLPRYDDASLAEEMTGSKRMLEEITGQTVDLFAYPYADYDRRSAEAARSAGYRAAFAVDPIPVGLPAYEIPRIDLYWTDPAYLDVKLSGLFRRPIKDNPLAEPTHA
jgi:peptidoglycan/xylan/chitin deacetylase (PgdA/CDA1 family)